MRFEEPEDPRVELLLQLFEDELEQQSLNDPRTHGKDHLLLWQEVAHGEKQEEYGATSEDPEGIASDHFGTLPRLRDHGEPGRSWPAEEDWSDPASWE